MKMKAITPGVYASFQSSDRRPLVLLRHKTLMVRRRPCAVSNHEGHVACFGASSFETLARASSSGWGG